MGLVGMQKCSSCRLYKAKHTKSDKTQAHELSIDTQEKLRKAIISRKERMQQKVRKRWRDSQGGRGGGQKQTQNAI